MTVYAEKALLAAKDISLREYRALSAAVFKLKALAYFDKIRKDEQLWR